MKKRRVKFILFILIAVTVLTYWNISRGESLETEKRDTRTLRNGINPYSIGITIATTMSTVTAMPRITTRTPIPLNTSFNTPRRPFDDGGERIREKIIKPKKVQMPLHGPSDVTAECAAVQFDHRDQNRVLMVPSNGIKADCPLLFNPPRPGNVPGYGRSIRRQLKKWETDISDTSFMFKLTNDCTNTLNNFTNSFYVSKEEKDFPIAFEFLAHYKPVRIQQYIRLIKNLYRPHNVYCIHIDGKAPEWWSDMLIRFADCFPNIFIAKNRIEVKYGTARILYAHFQCFSELLETQYDWKYVISLHGTELPLVTNREMVEVLRKMNGTNLIQKGEDSSKESAQSHAWITYKVKSINDGKKVILTNETLGPVPYNLSIYKSAASANSAFSRDFISFIFSDPRSVALADFLNDVQSAVEMFFSTVNFFPNAPGGYHTFQGADSSMPLIAKRDWVFFRKTFKKYCFAKKLVHNICIVSVLDLPRLGTVSENRSWWFHNKYFIEYDHVVMNCMENLLLRRNALEYERDCL